MSFHDTDDLQDNDDLSDWSSNTRKHKVKKAVTTTKSICKFCKTENLEWKEVDSKWRLYDNGVPHVCEKFTTPFDEPVERATLSLRILVCKNGKSKLQQMFKVGSVDEWRDVVSVNE